MNIGADKSGRYKRGSAGERSTITELRMNRLLETRDRLPRTQRSKVLLVEDHALLARATARMVLDAGCDVVGPAASIADAVALARDLGPQVALVDYCLRDGSAEELVARLGSMGVRCAVLSGYARREQPAPALADIPWLEKPVSPEQLEAVLQQLCAEGNRTEEPAPSPLG
jgi:DNA-binding NarL/FixJ family response regulator